MFPHVVLSLSQTRPEKTFLVMNVHQKHCRLNKEEAAHQLVFCFFEFSASVNPSSLGTELYHYFFTAISQMWGSDGLFSSLMAYIEAHKIPMTGPLSCGASALPQNKPPQRGFVPSACPACSDRGVPSAHLDSRGMTQNLGRTATFLGKYGREAQSVSAKWV